ncbi:DEAD/DEAH box helicase family protein [Streptomyces sp. SID13666]|uniref:DEAD/DEAH box helicase family protein n=1 Tax=Streptomyces sp. SID13666 TaxID=2706054 RepID=UPI0013BF4E93|nr:DEAD/DEAH box helicase family protein [Streptomyces sp. SID13666]NEA53578.1 DEAD/DEAH box helicase family protein [Streptomyces sp. SID13666]
MLNRPAAASVAGALSHDLEVKVTHRPWNPSLHPRDSKGRFIETGGVVKLWGGGLARVLRALPNDRVLVQDLQGNNRRHSMSAKWVTMVTRPDGSRPTKSKDKVEREDLKRIADVRRGDGAALDDDGTPDSRDAPHTHDDDNQPIGDDTGDGPHAEDDQDAPKPLANRRAQAGARFADTAAVRRHWTDRANDTSLPIEEKQRNALKAMAEDPDLEITRSGHFALRRRQADHGAPLTWYLTATGNGLMLPSSDFEKKNDAEAAADFLHARMLGKDGKPLDFSDPDVPLLTWRSDRNEDAGAALERVRKDQARRNGAGLPPQEPAAARSTASPTPTPSSAPFRTVAAVRQHWASGSRDRPWARDPRTNNANRALPGATSSDKTKIRLRLYSGKVGSDLHATAQLSRDGHFVVNRSGAGKWYVYHSRSGLLMNDRAGHTSKRDALAFANDLEDARTPNGKPFDWDSPDVGDRLRIYDGPGTMNAAIARGHQDDQEHNEPAAAPAPPVAAPEPLPNPDTNPAPGPAHDDESGRDRSDNPNRSAAEPTSGDTTDDSDGAATSATEPYSIGGDLRDAEDKIQDAGKRWRTMPAHADMINAPDDSRAHQHAKALDQALRGAGHSASVKERAREWKTVSTVADVVLDHLDRSETRDRDATARQVVQDIRDQAVIHQQRLKATQEAKRARRKEKQNRTSPAAAARPDNQVTASTTTDTGETTDGNEQDRTDRASALGDVPAGGVRGAGDRGGEDGVLRGTRPEGGAADRGPGGRAAEPADRGRVRGSGERPDAGPESGPGTRHERRSVPAGRARAGERGAAEPRRGVTAPRFRPATQGDLAPSGEKAKARANVEAVKTLRRIQAEDRPATAQEQQILARWSGWGSLPVVLSDKPVLASFRSKGGQPAFERALKRWESFAAERATVRDLLNDREWAAASRNVLNAHYTDAGLVRAMWDAVRDLGFEGGNVLEPGSGSGNFIGTAPDGAHMTGVELDPTTAAISQLLYPDAQILNESFAKVRLPRDSFDLTIGNVPFGQTRLPDAQDNPGEKHAIHDHFILKSLARTRPGGLVAVITSRHTMDNENESARRSMWHMADLVGAARLPEGAHEKAAGTHVVSDVLIFRRRFGDEQPGDSSWLRSQPMDLNGHQIRFNRYFQDHPETVLGEMTTGRGQFSDHELTVKGDKDAATQLRAALGRINASAYGDRQRYVPPIDAQDKKLELDGVKHEGAIVHLSDGTLAKVDEGRLVPLDVHPSQQEQLHRLLRLRDLTKQLLTLERETEFQGETAEMRDLRADLNAAYDDYVGKHGALDKPGQVRAFSPPGMKERALAQGYKDVPASWRVPTALSLFEDDPGSAVAFGLDQWDANAKKARKLAILDHRVLAPRKIADRAENPEQAVALAMEHDGGHLNIATVARLLNTDELDAREQLGSLAFDDPASGRLVDRSEYLSGNVRVKLAAARAAAAGDPKYAANVAALEPAIPRDLDPAEIKAKMGAPWIPETDITAFLQDILGTQRVRVEHGGGSMWEVSGPREGTSATVEWGTPKKPAPDIAQALLEQRSVEVTRRIKNPDGSYTTVKDADATDAAQAKSKEMALRFGEWIWEDPERAQRLARVYNDRFNNLAMREYDDSPLALPGADKDWKMRPHQNAAIRRIVQEPTVLLAHVVGAGKTATMVAGTQELRRTGLAKKPAIVIPNHMVGQFRREYLELYPDANILVASSSDLTGDKRRKFVGKVATGNWDAVIITQQAFKSIPMRPDAQKAYMAEELDRLREQINKAKQRDGKSLTLKRLEAMLDNAEAKLAKKLDGQKDHGAVYFEDTGIDYLMVDEAHHFKNLYTVSHIEGASVQGSSQASDLHMKLGYLRERNASGRVATLATGTPIANSVVEAFTMQRYLRPDILAEAGVDDFDQWAATFGEVIQSLELAPDGSGFRKKARFARFHNAAELLRMYRLSTDVRTAKDLNLPTPPVRSGEDGKRGEVVIVPISAEQKAFVTALPDEPWVRKPGGILKAIGLASRAAVDMRMVGGHGEDGGKIHAAVRSIADIYEENKNRVYPVSAKNLTPQELPGALQIVFMDLGVPDSAAKNAWDGYAEMKSSLIDEGVPAEKIRFIHEAKTDKAKAKLFEDARSGRIAVLIGSTSKMGTGTNIQDRAVALHHMDFPWRPADISQRDGRIERQGNLNMPEIPGTADDIRILSYVTEETFDAFKLGTLERKATFIAQMDRKDFDLREMEDIGDTAVSFGMMKAIATGDTTVMDYAQASSDAVDLQRLDRNWQREQNSRRNTVADATNVINALNDLLPAWRSALATRTDTTGDNFQITLNGEEHENRADVWPGLAAAVTTAVKNMQLSDGDRVPLGTLGGHAFHIEIGHDKYGTRIAKVRFDYPEWENPYDPDTRGVYSIRQLDDMSGRGILTSLERRLANLDEQVTTGERNLAHAQDERDKAARGIGGTSPYGEHLKTKERQVGLLADLITANERLKKKKEPQEGEDRKDYDQARAHVAGLKEELATEDKKEKVLTDRAAAAKKKARAAAPVTLDPAEVRDQLDAIRPEGASATRDPRITADRPPTNDEGDTTPEPVAPDPKQADADLDARRPEDTDTPNQGNEPTVADDTAVPPTGTSGDTVTLDPDAVRAQLDAIRPDASPADAEGGASTPVAEPSAPNVDPDAPAAGEDWRRMSRSDFNADTDLELFDTDRMRQQQPQGPRPPDPFGTPDLFADQEAQAAPDATPSHNDEGEATAPATADREPQADPDATPRTHGEGETAAPAAADQEGATPGSPETFDGLAEGDEVITPEGPGRVITVHNGIALVQTDKRMHPWSFADLRHPGDEATPIVDAATADRERQNRADLAQASTPEGLELRYGNGNRLKDLDTVSGHGTIVDRDGNTIGWVRARMGDDGKRYWWAQDAAGGSPDNMPFHERLPATAGVPAVRAAGTIRTGMPDTRKFDGTVDENGSPNLIAVRHIEPDRARKEIVLTTAQVRELGKLTVSGTYADGSPLHTLPWNPGHRFYSPDTAQMRALAEAARNAAAELGDDTPEERRNKKVLLGAAAKLDFEQYDAGRQFASMPQPGEPDPYSQPFVPRPDDVEDAEGSLSTTSDERRFTTVDDVRGHWASETVRPAAPFSALHKPQLSDTGAFVIGRVTGKSARGMDGYWALHADSGQRLGMPFNTRKRAEAYARELEALWVDGKPFDWTTPGSYDRLNNEAVAQDALARSSNARSTGASSFHTNDGWRRALGDVESAYNSLNLAAAQVWQGNTMPEEEGRIRRAVNTAVAALEDNDPSAAEASLSGARELAAALLGRLDQRQREAEPALRGFLDEIDRFLKSHRLTVQRRAREDEQHRRADSASRAQTEEFLRNQPQAPKPAGPQDETIPGGTGPDVSPTPSGTGAGVTQPRYGGDMVPTEELSEGDWVSVQTTERGEPVRMVGRVHDIRVVSQPNGPDAIQISIESKNPGGRGTFVERAYLQPGDLVERLQEGNPGREDTSDLARRLVDMERRQKAARVRVPEGWHAPQGHILPHPGDRFRIAVRDSRGVTYRDIETGESADYRGDGYWSRAGESWRYHPRDIVAVPDGAEVQYVDGPEPFDAADTTRNGSPPVSRTSMTEDDIRDLPGATIESPDGPAVGDIIRAKTQNTAGNVVVREGHLLDTPTQITATRDGKRVKAWRLYLSQHSEQAPGDQRNAVMVLPGDAIARLEQPTWDGAPTTVPNAADLPRTTEPDSNNGPSAGTPPATAPEDLSGRALAEERHSLHQAFLNRGTLDTSPEGIADEARRAALDAETRRRYPDPETAFDADRAENVAPEDLQVGDLIGVSRGGSRGRFGYLLAEPVRVNDGEGDSWRFVMGDSPDTNPEHPHLRTDVSAGSLSLQRDPQGHRDAERSEQAATGAPDLNADEPQTDDSQVPQQDERPAAGNDAPEQTNHNGEQHDDPADEDPADQGGEEERRRRRRRRLRNRPDGIGLDGPGLPGAPGLPLPHLPAGTTPTGGISDDRSPRLAGGHDVVERLRAAARRGELFGPTIDRAHQAFMRDLAENPTLVATRGGGLVTWSDDGRLWHFAHAQTGRALVLGGKDRLYSATQADALRLAEQYENLQDANGQPFDWAGTLDPEHAKSWRDAQGRTLLQAIGAANRDFQDALDTDAAANVDGQDADTPAALPDDLTSLSDEDIAAAWSAGLSAHDAARAVDEMDRRDAVDARVRAVVPETPPANEDEQFARGAAMDETFGFGTVPIADGPSPRRQTKDERLRREFMEWEESQFQLAEDITNGYMLSREGQKAGLSHREVFSSGRLSGDRWRPYASEELIEWFALHPRMTYNQWRERQRDNDRIDRERYADDVATPESPQGPGETPEPDLPAAPAYDPKVPRFHSVEALRDHLRAGNFDAAGPGDRWNNFGDSTPWRDVADSKKLFLSRDKRLAVFYNPAATWGHWSVAVPGSMRRIVNDTGMDGGGGFNSKTTAMKAASTLEGIKDADGNPFPWDAPDAPERALAFRGPDGETLAEAMLRAMLGDPPHEYFVTHAGTSRVKARRAFRHHAQDWYDSQAADGYTVPFDSADMPQVGDEVSFVADDPTGNTLLSTAPTVSGTVRGTITRAGHGSWDNNGVAALGSDPGWFLNMDDAVWTGPDGTTHPYRYVLAPWPEAFRRRPRSDERAGILTRDDGTGTTPTDGSQHEPQQASLVSTPPSDGPAVRPKPADEPQADRSTSPEEKPAPEPIGGRPAQWARVEDLVAGDVARVEGTTKGGRPVTRAGFVMSPPVRIAVTRRGHTEDMWRTHISESPDAKSGVRGVVYTPLDGAAAKVDAQDIIRPQGAPATGAEGDVIAGNIADSVPADAAGHGVFPGSTVTGTDGREGAVLGATSTSADIHWAGDDTPDDGVAPTTLNVTDGGASRPTGWTSNGQRVRPGHVVSEPDGSLLGTVDAVDGDTVTVSTPQGIQHRPASGVRVTGEVRDTAPQGAPIAALVPDTVGDINEHDVVLLDLDGQPITAEITGTHRDGDRVTLDYVDTTTGEMGTLEADASAVITRATGPNGGAPNLGPADAPATGGDLTVHEPPHAMDSVTGPVTDPPLTPADRDAIDSHGEAPEDDPDAQQAAARIADDLPITAQQAGALADSLRTTADPATGEGRAARRAADHLDEATGRTPAPDSTTPTPGTVSDITDGDLVTIPEPGAATTEPERIVRTVPGPGGTLTITSEDADGNRTSRTLPGSTPLFQLPDPQGPPAPAAPTTRDPNATPPLDDIVHNHAGAVIRALINAAITGTQQPGTIHALREQIAQALDAGAAADLRRIQRDTLQALDLAGIQGADRDAAMRALREATAKARTATRLAAVRTLDDLEPLPGETPEETAARAADLLRRIPDNIDVAAIARTGQRPTARVRADSTVAGHVNDVLGRALADAATAAGERRLTNAQVAVIANRAVADMQAAQAAAARRILAGVPAAQRQRLLPGILALLVRIARKIGAILMAALRALVERWRNRDRDRLARLRRRLVTMLPKWPEMRAMRQLLDGASDLQQPDDGQDLAGRVAHWAHLLPAPGQFGRTPVRRRTFRPAPVADLRAGILPATDDQTRWSMDRDADGGPGRTALRHLAALRAAGAEIDQDVSLRMQAAAPDLGADPHAAARFAAHYADAAERRLATLIAAGEGGADADLEIAAARAEALAGRADADRLTASYRAAAADAVLAALADVRPMGPDAEAQLRLRGGATARNSIGRAAQLLPTDWVRAVGGTRVTAATADSGSYDPQSGTLTVADLGDDGMGTALHGLAQLLQDRLPDVAAAQELYRFARTHQGRPGRRRPDPDNPFSRLFSHLTEGQQEDILARGLQAMFVGDWYEDDDLRAFLLGLLGTR